jgi:hypothetical protein
MPDLSSVHDLQSDPPCWPRTMGVALVRDLATSVRDSVLRQLSRSAGNTIRISPMSPQWLQVYEDDSSKHAAQP